MNKIPEPALPPKVPCADCLIHSTVSLGPSHGLLQATYCEHNQSGALLSRNSTTDFWRVYTPITGDAFAYIVNQETENFMKELRAAKDAVQRLTQKR